MNWWSGHMTVQQTVELSVIWDAMELMLPHYNGMNSNDNISKLIPRNRLIQYFW